ncbi:preprotein translocase subunit SecG [Roseateles amylovorans]|uniref:Protein-export membrane protein SecG n=1 Tax=Roseateles amylovorans TaxID=2978473 RepID=A0ABY6AVH7_9BURK|nr:preprotein translocase subunit SecG [Roseateles amylovorans]UXH76318.1 preprotein translocase subunit SecG [Roseateles amylovorans]
MQVLMNLVLVLQLVAALSMIGLVLVQHGKGADMGASFGSGASGSLFGATGSANFLSRSTAVAATIFFVCTLALAYMGSHREGGVGSGPSAGEQLLERAVTPAPVASEAAPGAALNPAAPASGASN